MPLLRDLLLAVGFVDAGRPTAKAALAAGLDLTVLPGGEKEQLEAAPGRDFAYVAHRKGFCKLALEARAPVATARRRRAQNASKMPSMHTPMHRCANPPTRGSRHRVHAPIRHAPMRHDQSTRQRVAEVAARALCRGAARRAPHLTVPGREGIEARPAGEPISRSVSEGVGSAFATRAFGVVAVSTCTLERGR